MSLDLGFCEGVYTRKRKGVWNLEGFFEIR
jgi:hypothetical protein